MSLNLYLETAEDIKPVHELSTMSMHVTMAA